MASGEETTFRNFTVQQAREYNASRGRAYPTKLYEHILAYLKANGGQTNLALDLGCGPGNATRDLSAYFNYVIGVDGSAEMVNAAKELIPKEMVGKIMFEAVNAEEIHETPEVAEGSVDAITVATAVHWFDLPRFYAAACKVLRPGGIIAIWSPGRPQLRADSVAACKINEVMEKLYTKLEPYRQERSHIARDMYAHLPLPWTLVPPVKGFNIGSFERTIFSDANGNQLSPSTQYTVSQAERMLGSGSPVVRWREANPDLVDTDQDIVRSHFDMIREILGKDDGLLNVDAQFGLLLWRKND